MLENNLNAAAARMFLQNEIERKWNARPDNETIRRMLRFMRKWPKTTSYCTTYGKSNSKRYHFATSDLRIVIDEWEEYYEDIAKHYVFGKGE